MKKVFTAICGLLLALSLSACTGQETQRNPPTSATSSESLSNVETSNSDTTSEEAVSSSQESSTSSKEISTPSQESVTSSKETTASSQEPATSSKEDTASSKEPTTPEKKPATSTPEPPAPPKEPTPTVTESTPSKEPLPPPQPEPPSSSETEPTTKPEPPQSTESEEVDMSSMQITIGDQTFTATLETNSGAKAFAELLKSAPVVLAMSDYSGFEKVANLGSSLPTSNQQITTQSGDIVLYNGNQIVIFYGSNSWSYTRLGRIDDLSGWETALGSGGVTVTFSLS